MKKTKKLFLGLLLATVATCFTSSHINGMSNEMENLNQQMEQMLLTNSQDFPDDCLVETAKFYINISSIKKTYSYLRSLSLTNKKFHKIIKPHLARAKQAWDIYCSDGKLLKRFKRLEDLISPESVKSIDIAFLSPFIFNTRNNINNDTFLIYLVKNNKLALIKKIIRGIMLLGYNDDDEILKGLLKHGLEYANFYQLKNSNTKLAGNKAIRRFVNQMNCDNKNVFDFVINNEWLTILFKYCGAKPVSKNIKELNKNLFDVIINNDLNEVREIISAGVNVNAEDKHGKIPLHWAAILGYLDIVKCLINNGANVNVKDKHGYTPLYFAIICEHIDIVECLINNGANIETRAMDGSTPVDLANPKIAKLIESYKPSSCTIL